MYNIDMTHTHRCGALLTVGWLTFTTGRVTDEVSTAQWLLVWQQRLVGQLLSWAVGVAFLALVPHGRTRVTDFGKNSLYAYVMQVRGKFLRRDPRIHRT
jgi:hypothetical protein